VISTNIFNFQYEGDSFQIVSLNSETGEGANILRSDSFKNEKAYARDINQDGILDVVIFANADLEELNKIYQSGIFEAMSSNMLQEKVNQRIYEFETVLTLYSITGYYLGAEIYNVFTIVDRKTLKEESFIDLYADGSINDDSIPEEELLDIQKQYELVLENGINDRSIEYKDGMYVVLRNEEILAYR